MITFILIYACIGMWLAADVVRFAPHDLEAPDWFIAGMTALFWPFYILLAVFFLIKKHLA